MVRETTTRTCDGCGANFPVDSQNWWRLDAIGKPEPPPTLMTLGEDGGPKQPPYVFHRKHKIEYEPAELTRSELYLELLPMVNSGAVELLDNTRLIGQLAGLERRVGRSGKDSIDHRPGSHDDAANAAAGALVHALRSDEFATLPASFQWCNRAASIASFNMTQCYLFHGGFKPPMDICCKNCEGHKFVLAAVKAHTERTGEPVYYVTFYRERIAPNDLVSRVLANRWADAMGI